MGLDVTLGFLVLLGAIRGWVRGFALQAVRLAALVGCVYVADPARDLVRPLAQDYLPGIRLEVLDKLLWWSCAVVSLVVLSGIGSISVYLTRKRPYGQREPGRSDRGAGFLLGAAKAAVVVSFLASAIVKYGPDYAPRVGDWAVDQMKTSQTLALAKQYRPAERIWASPPVRQFVARIRDRGLIAPEVKDVLTNPAPAPAPGPAAHKAESTAAREAPKSLVIPQPGDADLDKEIAELRDELERARARATASDR
jgi:uncharacterized membrane protein required for colicin V production